MAIVRKIIDSRKLAEIINLPLEMKDKKVEITVRSLKEEKENPVFDPSSYRGILKVENIEQEIKQIRAEWDRN